MDFIQRYVVALGDLEACSVTLYLLWPVMRIIRTYATFCFLKYIIYTQICRLLRGSSKTTRFDVVLVAGFLTGYVICFSVEQEMFLA